MLDQAEAAMSQVCASNELLKLVWRLKNVWFIYHSRLTVRCHLTVTTLTVDLLDHYHRLRPWDHLDHDDLSFTQNTTRPCNRFLPLWPWFIESLSGLTVKVPPFYNKISKAFQICLQIFCSYSAGWAIGTFSDPTVGFRLLESLCLSPCLLGATCKVASTCLPSSPSPSFAARWPPAYSVTQPCCQVTKFMFACHSWAALHLLMYHPNIRS